MVDSSVSFQLVSIAEAARILAVSDSTVRRLVKSGRLESEKVQRPQGHVWLVRVPAPSSIPPEEPPRQIGASPANPPGQDALAAWTRSVLEPLVTELSVTRQQLVSQAETIGALRATVAAQEARITTLDASTVAPAPEPSTWPSARWWRSWAVYGVVGLLVVVIVIVAISTHW